MFSKKLVQIFPIFSGIMWGSAGIFVRGLAENGMDSTTIVATRIYLALLFIILGVFKFDKSLLKIKFKDIWIFILGGLFGVLGLNLCYNFAINELTLSLSAVLLSLAPIFVLIMAAFIFKEKITIQKVVCIILALVGSVFSSGVLESSSTMKWSYIGIAIGTLGTLFFATYGIFSKIAIQRGYKPFTVTIYSMLSVAIVLIPFTDWNIIGKIITKNPMEMSSFMFLHSLFTSILPYIFYTISLNYIEAGKASILASCEPVAATFFGVLFFNEIPTPLSILGLITVMFALILLTIKIPKKSNI